MLFNRLYKLAYLTLIILNLLWFYVEVGHTEENLDLYEISAIVFLINLVGWIGYSRGYRWGKIIESALSVGRLFAIALAATIFGADLVVWLSPLGWLLWYKILLIGCAGSYVLYWIGCLVLAVLEGIYLWTLTNSSLQNSSSARNYQTKGTIAEA